MPINRQPQNALDNYVAKSYGPLDNEVLRHHFTALARNKQLYRRPPLTDAGDSSTISTIIAQHDELNGGQPTVIPTIWDGREVSAREAVMLAIRSKKKWPTADPNQPWAQSPDADWHGYMRRMGGPPLAEDAFISNKYRF